MNDCLRLAPFLTGPQASSLPLWRMTNDESLLTESLNSLTSLSLCYDRRPVDQSVLDCSTHLGLTTRSLLLLNSYGFVDVGRSLWREDRYVVYSCCWSSPGKSFTGLSPLELATVFYCLRFETSLSVASYYSQGYGGGIRPRLHTGITHGIEREKVTLRLAFYRQSFRLGAEPLETYGQFFFKLNTCGHSPYVVYNCRWPSPAHSHTG
jgi:hypothetical protein